MIFSGSGTGGSSSRPAGGSEEVTSAVASASRSSCTGGEDLAHGDRAVAEGVAGIDELLPADDGGAHAAGGAIAD